MCTHIHERVQVTDNPEDPIFYSTCLVRDVVKKWLPLTGTGEEKAAPAASWAYNAGKHCLDCDSYNANHGRSGGQYNTTTLETRHWWLQDQGTHTCDIGHFMPFRIFSRAVCFHCSGVVKLPELTTPPFFCPKNTNRLLLRL